MAYELFVPPSRALDSNASPYSGAKWKFYASGTSTPQNVFSNSTLVTSLGSVVTADSGGKFVPIYFDPTLSYRGVCENSTGSVTLHDIDPINTGLFSQFADDTGAAQIGTSDGSNVQARLLQPRVSDGAAATPSISFASDTDTGFFRSAANVLGFAIAGIAKAFMNAAGLTIGGSASSAARMTVYTQTGDVLNSLEIFAYADQTNAANTTIAEATHVYNDGAGKIIDMVGAGTALLITQARNPTARADKASTYVGTGFFSDLQRATSTGTGGNLGTGRNRLRYTDGSARQIRLGFDTGDFDGAFGNAVDQWRPISGAAKGGYMGWRESVETFVIGAIDTNTSTFKTIVLAALGILPPSDKFSSIGSTSLRYEYVHAYTVTTKPVTVATLPAAATAGAGARAFVSDANATTFASTVAGGGSNNVPVYSDGTNWKIG